MFYLNTVEKCSYTTKNKQTNKRAQPIWPLLWNVFCITFHQIRQCIMHTIWFLELFSNRKQASKKQRKDMKFVENFRTLRSLLGSGQIQRAQHPVPGSCSLPDQEEHPACLSLSSPGWGSRLEFLFWSEQQLWFIVLPRCAAETQGCLQVPLCSTRNELHTSFLLPCPGPGFCCRCASVFPMQAPPK